MNSIDIESELKRDMDKVTKCLNELYSLDNNLKLFRSRGKPIE